MVPGVAKLVLAPKTQKKLDLVVGDDVTSQKPWKLVPKKQLYKYIRSPMGKDLAMFMEQLDEYTGKSSVFHALRDRQPFPRQNPPYPLPNTMFPMDILCAENFVGDENAF